MYKLLIVDDELLIREGLARNIDWESIGFTVCCTAASGEEAYELTAAYQPDVLITDISMANMDGIALMKNLRKDGFTLPIVIISGYDDFKYAQQAIKYGAVEYLLKPIDETALRNLFVSIREKLDSSNRENGTKSAPMHSAATRNVLQRSVMMMYLEGQTKSVDTLLPLIEFYGLQTDQTYSVAVLSAEPNVLSMLERGCSHGDWGCKLLTFRRQDILILLFSGARSHVAPLLAAFLHCQAPHCQGASAYCLLESGAFDALPVLYRQIMATPFRFFYLAPWQISSLADAACTDSDFPMPAAQTLLAQIRSGSLEAFQASLAELTQLLQRQRPNPDTAAIWFSELYTKLVSLLRENGQSLQALTFHELYCLLCDCSNVSLFIETFQQHMMALASAAVSADRTKPSVITEVQRFIDSHYSENLSLSSLAKRFYLSPSYLSALFSRSAGSTFSSYLEKVRMEKGALLLRTTHRNISEISAAVGYQNSRYFCRLFKEYYSCTPTEYRRRSMEEQL